MNFNLNDFTLAWLSILFEGLPFVLLGTVISGFIEVFVPHRWFERVLPRNQNLAVPIAGALGAVFPMCECGIVPVLRRLIRKGVPPSVAVTYMLAAPSVNLITFVSTMAAFKTADPLMMALSRTIYAYVLAVAVGLILADLAPRLFLRDATGMAEGVVMATQRMAMGFWARIAAALQCSLGDFLETGAYLIGGAAIAAAFTTGIERATIEPFAENIYTAIPAMMLGAALLCLCSTSDAFVAAALFNFPSASQLAFLVFGPMIDLKLLVMYSLVFRTRFVIALAVGLAAGTFGLCLLHHFQAA